MVFFGEGGESRRGKKIRWSQGRVGSTPSAGTTPSRFNLPDCRLTNSIATNPTKNPPAEARGFLHRGLATYAIPTFHIIRERSRLPLRLRARVCQ